MNAKKPSLTSEILWTSGFLQGIVGKIGAGNTELARVKGRLVTHPSRFGRFASTKNGRMACAVHLRGEFCDRLRAHGDAMATAFTIIVWFAADCFVALFSPALACLLLIPLTLAIYASLPQR